MSNLGNRLQQTIDAITSLRTRAETPEGEPGDPWATEYEDFIHTVQSAVNAAAPDSIRNPDGSLGAAVNNDATTTGELSVGTENPVSSWGGNLSVGTDGALNASSTDTQLTDEQVQDIVGGFVTGTGATTVTYDDVNNALTISSTDENTDTQRTDEEIQDVVGSLLAASGSASVAYDDANNTLTVSATDTNTQLSDAEVRAAVEGITDAADLSGGLGTANQFLTTNGTDTSWVDLPSGSGGSVSGTSPQVYDLNRDYGADNTGATTCDTEFDSAVADAGPRDIIRFSNGEFLLNAAHTINKPITLQTRNATIVRSANNGVAAITIEGGGLTGVSTTTDTAIQRGETVVSVTDASVFSRDDVVLISASGYDRTADYNFQFTEVSGVDTTNNNITITSAVYEDFPTGTAVEVVDLLSDIKLDGVDVAGTDTTGDFSWFKLRWCRDCIVERVSVRDYMTAGVWITNGFGVTVRDCVIRDANRKGSTEGEPLKLNRVQDGHVENVHVYDCRRGIDLPRHSHGIEIVNCVAEKYVIMGYGGHQSPVQDVHISGGYVAPEIGGTNPIGVYFAFGSKRCSVSGTSIGYVSDGTRAYGRDISFSGVTFTAPEPAGSALALQGTNITVDATFDDPDGNIGNADAAVALSPYNGTLSNASLDIEGELAPSDSVLKIGGTANETVSDIEVRGSIDASGGTGRGIDLYGDAPITITNVTSTLDMKCDSYAVFFFGGPTYDQITVRDCSLQTNGSTAIITNANPTLTNIRCQSVTANDRLAPGNDNTSYMWVTDCHSPNVDISAGATNVETRGNNPPT